MMSLPTNSPASVAVLDDRDPAAGNASHTYAVQFGGPEYVCVISFQHGPRGEPGSVPGVFDDDLLAILQDRLEGFQSGPYACAENEVALDCVMEARRALGRRVARRMSQGVLGASAPHQS